jgi:glycosyltransferase involved in cell wall biosynthesis
MPPDALPLISFVVPVRNDATRLRRCLASIRHLRYPSHRIEIVVADNGSVDDSAAVARQAEAVVLDLPGVRVAHLRNSGAQAARGTIIAFVDADHEIDEGWAESAVDTLRGDHVAAVGAQYRAPPDGTWVQRHYDRLRRHPPGVGETDWLSSGNIALWRQAFDSLGGFDARLETCEDVDLCHRLRASGARLMSDSRLKSTHFGDPRTLRELFLGELWRGRNNVRVSLRRPLVWRSLVSLGLALFQLLLLLAIAIGALTGSRSGLQIASAAGLAVLALTAMQAARMLRHHSLTAVDLVQAPAVALVYSTARALALVVRGTHQARQGRRPPR